MAGLPAKLDDVDSLRRFFSALNSNSPNTESSRDSGSGPLDASSDLEKDTIITDTNTENAISHVSSTAPTPTVIRSRAGSESVHPSPSPVIRGVLPPHNSPQTMPQSPSGAHAEDGNSSEDDSNPVQQVHDILSNFKGKGLGQSMWAGKSYKPSRLSREEHSREELTPTKVVKHNDAIHDTYRRMSFKAVDPDHDRDSLAGDKVPVNPFTDIKPLNDKLEALRSKSADSYKQSLMDSDNNTTEKETSPSKSSQNSAQQVELKVSFQTPRKDSVHSSTPSYPTTSSSSGEDLEEWGGQEQGVPIEQSSTSMTDDLKISEEPITGETSDMIGSVAETPSSEKDLPPHLRHLQKVTGKNASSQGVDGPSRPPSAKITRGETSVSKHINIDISANASPDRKATELKEAASPISSPKTSEILQQPDSPEDEVLEKFRPSGDASTESTPTKLSPSIETPSPKVSSDRKYTATVNASNPANAEEPAGDFESKVLFGAWPKSQARDRPAAKIRTVVIKSVPLKTTVSSLAQKIWGGPLERIHFQPTSSTVSSKTALIRFLDPEACDKFHKGTSKGLIVGHDIQYNEQIASVQKGADVDVVGGILNSWIQAGVTRCVRAIPVDPHMSREYLWKIAERKGRVLEGLEEGKSKNGISKVVIWRFCDIDHAVKFKGALARDEEWEDVNVAYGDDPCDRECDSPSS